MLTQVETLDVLELVLALAKPRDFVVLRMDIEGAEYEARSSPVMRGLLLRCILRLIKLCSVSALTEV